MNRDDFDWAVRDQERQETNRRQRLKDNIAEAASRDSASWLEVSLVQALGAWMRTGTGDAYTGVNVDLLRSARLVLADLEQQRGGR